MSLLNVNARKWDSSSVTATQQLINQDYPNLLRRFLLFSNSYHSVDYDNDFYELVAGSWLIHYLHLCYITFDHISSFEPPDKPQITDFSIPCSESEFTTLTNTQWFHHRFQALMLLYLDGDVSKIQYSFKQTNARNVKLKLYEKASIISTKFKYKLSSSQILISRPYWFLSRHDRKKFTQLLPNSTVDNQSYLESNSFHPNIEKRMQTHSCLRSVSSDNVLSIAINLLPFLAPLSIVEGLLSNYTRVMKLYKKPPKILYTSLSLWNNLSYKLLAADCKQKGSRLLTSQHGGNYGTDYSHVLEQYEISVSDKFYSWGWQSSNAKVYPLGHPRTLISTLTQSLILFVSSDYPVYPPRVHYQPMGNGVYQMHKSALTLLSLLSKSLDILVRPYHIDYGWNFENTLREISPSIKFDSKTSLETLYANSKLVIHERIGTSYLITLANNIPTIVMYDDTINKFRLKYEHLFDKLVEVGIAHSCPLSAADFVYSICHDISSWWNSPTVQSVVQEFVANQANFSSCNDVVWSDELYSQLSLVP